MNRAINWWLLGTVFLLGFIIYLLKPILTPFFIAALLAYLGDPLVHRLVRLRMPRTLAVIIVFTLFLSVISLLIVLIIPLLERQIIIFINKIPQIIDWTQTVALPWLSLHFGIQNITDTGQIQKLLTNHWEQASNVAAVLIKTITQSGFALFVFLLNLILIPVVTFYLLRDWDGVIIGIHRLIPRGIESTVTQLAHECNEVIGAFFRGQLLVMLTLAVFYVIALSITGLQLALLIGVIIGLISIVPYLGFIVGILMAIIASYVQFHDWVHIFYILIIFSIGHVFENYLLYPWLVGDRIGLHPVLVIFAILAGGQLFGIIGVLLALPIAAVIMVLLRYTIGHYLNSEWYSRLKQSLHNHHL